MSEFWVFTLTVGAWIFLAMGIAAGVIWLAANTKSFGKIIAGAIGCLLIAILFAMYVWICIPR